MTAPKFSTWIAASLLLAVGGALSQAQDTPIYVDSTDHDLQFFSPVDFDFENRPIGQSCGYFFRYDKVNWAMTSERNVIGAPGLEVLSELIVPDALANSFGVTDRPLPMQQYTVINGINNAPPFAQFAMGDRYEVGYGNGEVSWSVGILDGPAQNTHKTFGIGPGNLGFGSIHVNFITPEDFLLGLRDYWGSGAPQDGFVAPTPVFTGPGGTGDGFVDDLDGDGAEGPNFVVDADGTVIGIVFDLDDLHVFNITFDELIIRNRTETDGVELMKTHHLDNRHLPVSRQNEHVQFGYGVRYFRLGDEFSLDGTSPLLGTANIMTETENQIVGPQIRASWSKQNKRFNLALDGRCMFGYNITDFAQMYAIGLDDVVNGNDGLVPGRLNRLIGAQPTVGSIGKQEDHFSPLVEFRAQGSYQITSALALRLGYTAIFIDNISRASMVTQYSLPDTGLLEGGKQEILINGVDFGFEAVY